MDPRRAYDLAGRLFDAVARTVDGAFTQPGRRTRAELVDILLEKDGEPEFAPYDPIADESRQMSLKEWVALLKNELDAYEKEWTEQPNEYHQQKHTWSQWMGIFHRYMSW